MSSGAPNAPTAADFQQLEASIRRLADNVNIANVKAGGGAVGGNGTGGGGGTGGSASSHMGKVGRMWSGAKQSIGRAKSYFKTGAARGKAVGGRVGGMVGMRGAGGMAGGAVGGVAGAAVAVGVAMYKAGEAVVKWTDEAMASAAKLAEVSGSMATVMAERDVKQMQRDMARGENTSGSARKLMEAEDARKNAMAPIETAIDNLTNNLLAWGNDIITPIAEKIGDGVELLKTLPGIGKLLGSAVDANTKAEERNALTKEMHDMMKQIDIQNDIQRRMLDSAETAAAARMGGFSAPDGAAGPGMGLGGTPALPPL